MRQEFVQKLQNIGFMSLNGCEQGIDILYVIENNMPNVILAIDCDEVPYFSPLVMREVENKLTAAFNQAGFSMLRRHTIFFANNKKSMNGAGPVTGTYWIVFKEKRELVIYETQPDDFLGVRIELETVLYGKYIGESYKVEKAKVLSATNIIIAINVIAFIYMAIRGDVYDTAYLVECGGMFPEYVMEKHEYYRLVTCMFIHIGFSHLFNNMLVFFFIGNRLEQCIGRIKRIIMYLVAGIFSSVASCIWYYTYAPNTVSAGASGAVFAIIGGLLAVALFDRTKKYLFKSKLIIVFIAYELFSGITTAGVDNIAHIAGVIGGVFIGFIYAKLPKLKG